MSDKKYVGGGKVANYGIINIGIRAKDLPVPNEKGYINLCVGSRREVSKFGETHSVWVNDWVPGAGRTEERQEQTRQSFQPNDPIEPPARNDDGLPF
jgi:hypothetical protein